MSEGRVECVPDGSGSKEARYVIEYRRVVCNGTGYDWYYVVDKAAPCVDCICDEMEVAERLVAYFSQDEDLHKSMKKEAASYNVPPGWSSTPLFLRRPLQRKALKQALLHINTILKQYDER